MAEVPSEDGPSLGTSQRWTVVLPLKGGPAAKSRLGGPPGVATAIALDCLDAVLHAGQVAEVLVVTADPGLAGRCRDLGARTVEQSRPDGGLPAAITDGILAAVQRPCAVLLGDLPALRGSDLDQALQQVTRALQRPPPGSRPPMVFVPDAENTGTVLLAALRPADLRPCFGTGSAALHRAAGAAVLDLDLPRLRRDVDTPADLEAAIALGVGPRTRGVLSAPWPEPGVTGLTPALPDRPLRPESPGIRQRALTLSPMQATVFRYDPRTGAGSVITDQGLVLPFDEPAMRWSGLRHLRPGQRLTIELDDSQDADPAYPQVVSLRLGTIVPS